MTVIQRKTEVISISLPKDVAQTLEEERRRKSQSRSAFITALINKEKEEERWQRIYKKGAQTARKFKITSVDDIDRILHEKA